MIAPLPLTLSLPDEEATARLARALAPELGAGDTLALAGPIGAGKSFFARTLIRHRLNAVGKDEDIPSPTFTLVQTYQAGDLEIWHSDLYRLSTPDELFELGLEEAFETALCLIEWPDRMGEDLPSSALLLTFAPQEGDRRVVTLSSGGPAWPARLAQILKTGGFADD
ncbi:MULTISPECIES: tRNA (adenosine(37)-N6)-threonylcarbamoyltransferase complex ATPase subunit type 1 TsaE [unclassified Meridianimarinicoccus]|uniref:tRNA (adenosine(37)-N6)-threonylcarbamoyltransferase complex ATPase subunit type 1 TsaE n=1 Tax=unclassified Meridianimarinicoccus TaxID=2923344 RepID=UPI0018668C73|nr:tRNA (adenosine(37)-N6)-threonylcarbamoyltransferase complex ATPase subunit type 1 TsaE [Fluviibacterium sp. MJW13]